DYYCQVWDIYTEHPVLF
nr:immunoglobulin light chain junction region [Macaca mulatta]